MRFDTSFLRQGWDAMLPFGLVAALAATAPSAGHASGVSVGRQTPLLFEDVSEDGACIARAPGFAVALRAESATFWFKGAAPRPAVEPAVPAVVIFRLLDTEGGAALRPEQPAEARVNYFLGNDPARWRTGVETFRRVRVAGAYRGVDVVYYGSDRQLEYDFVVAPGADPAAIRFAIEGASTVRLTAEGDLAVSIGDREFRQRRPVAYQGADGRREPVSASFVMEGGGGPGTSVRFELGAYDPGRSLVIDPLVTYVSYFGGGAYDACQDLAVDTQGFVYLVGETASTNLALQNPLVNTNRGGLGLPQNAYGTDAFVARLTPDGTRLVFSTYFGGAQIDRGFSLALDPVDGVWICGLTHSPDFPVTPDAWAPRIHGEPDFGYYQWDSFVSHLDASGTSLLYSTYIGGLDEDQARQVVVEPGGRVYVWGDTKSGDFPRIGESEAIRRPYQGGRDAYVVCLEGTNVVYSRLIGGSGRELAKGMALAPTGELWVGGETESTNLPTTNAYQPVIQFTNTFVTITTNTSGQVVATTNRQVLVNASPGFFGRLERNGALGSLSYFGGADTNSVNALGLDPAGDLYLAGITSGAWGPFHWPGWTNTPPETVIHRQYFGSSAYDTAVQSVDVFVAKLDPSGTNLQYGTRLVANGSDRARRLAVAEDGSVTVVGLTTSTDLPLLHPNQIVNRGGTDGFLFQLAPSGAALTYSTYLGGTGEDELYQAVPRSDGTIWLAGFTTSEDWPDWTGATGYSTNYAAGEINPVTRAQGDGLVLRLGPQDTPELQLLSVNGTPTVSWPGNLPLTYHLQSTPSLLWTNVVLGNMGGVLGYVTNLVTNILKDVVTTNVVGGVTNVVTNAFVTNVSSVVDSVILGGTNIWVTNRSVPPASSGFFGTFTNTGGTTVLLTNLGTVTVLIPALGTGTPDTNAAVPYVLIPVQVQTAPIVPGIIGGTNAFAIDFYPNPWRDYPVSPIVVGGRYTVPLTNLVPEEFFRLERRP